MFLVVVLHFGDVNVLNLDDIDVVQFAYSTLEAAKSFRTNSKFDFHHVLNHQTNEGIY